MGNQVAKEVPHTGPELYSTYDAGGSFATVDGTAEQTIRFAPKGPASAEECPPMTIPQVFKAAVEKRSEKPALRVERPCPAAAGRGQVPPALPADQWTEWTWQKYYDDTKLVAKALMKIGVEQHAAVNIFGFNAPEWFMAETGAIFAGAKAAGIYPTDTPEQIGFKAKHSGASVAFIEDEGKLAKYAQSAKELPALKAIVVWGCEPTKVEGPNGDIPVYKWDDFLKLGAEVPEAELDTRIAAQKPGHCCALIYTSGTTGQPKAVMISHDNILFESNAVCKQMGNVGTVAEQERVLSYLPLSHVAGMMVDIICPLVITATRPGWITTSFARPYDLKFGSVKDRLQAVQPTLFLGVPRVWEKIAEALKAIGAKNPPGVKKNLIGWAKGVAGANAANTQLGGSGSTQFGTTFANVLTGKIKAALGLDKCKFGFTGAAPITKATLEYFGSLGIQINEVYGMSENCGATTWSTNECHVWGSCGYEIPGMEVKIFKVDPEDVNKKVECPLAKDLFELAEEEKGEVCFRGRHIMMGYMANPELGDEHVATINKKLGDAIDAEGWLHSGDQGAKDSRGMLRICGRYKELIIGAGGENIAPVPMEDRVKELCPAISNFLMIGDQQKYIVALVTLKAKGATGDAPGTDELDGAALDVKEGVTTISQAARDPDFIKVITDAIVATNKDGKVCPLAPASVKKFTILPADFSVQTEELTPTLKTKRSVVQKMHEAAWMPMYDPANKDAYVAHPAFAGAAAAEGGAAE